MRSNYLSLPRSVTRWLYYLSLFGHLQQLIYVQNLSKNCRSGSKVCQTKNKPSKVCLKFLKVNPSGEISPNLVTLLPSRSVFPRYRLPMFCVLIYLYLSFLRYYHRISGPSFPIIFPWGRFRVLLLQQKNKIQCTRCCCKMFFIFFPCLLGSSNKTNSFWLKWTLSSVLGT